MRNQCGEETGSKAERGKKRARGCAGRTKKQRRARKRRGDGRAPDEGFDESELMRRERDRGGAKQRGAGAGEG